MNSSFDLYRLSPSPIPAVNGDPKKVSHPAANGRNMQYRLPLYGVDPGDSRSLPPRRGKIHFKRFSAVRAGVFPFCRTAFVDRTVKFL